MAEWPGQTRTPRALGLVALAALLTGGAYAAKSPLHSPNAVVFDDADAESGLPMQVAARDTTRPRLLNREEVLAFAAKQPGLNASGLMRIYIDTLGRAEAAPTDNAASAFNDAVDRLTDVMRFSPAVVDGRKVGMWVSFNVRFGDGASALSAPSTYDAVPGQPPAPPAPGAPPAPARPTAVPAPPRLATPAPATPAPPPPALNRPTSKPAPAAAPRTASPAATAPGPKTAPAPAPPKIVPPSGSPPPAPAPPVIQRPQVPGVAVAVIDTPPPSPPPPLSPSVVGMEDGPVFTPMSVAPRMLNRDTVAAAVKRAYPQPMREAGIGGTTVVWLLLDDHGRAVKFQVQKSSGYPALDQAAIKVVPSMRFSAAEMQGKPIAVWVQVPVVFTPS